MCRPSPWFMATIHLFHTKKFVLDTCMRQVINERYAWPHFCLYLSPNFRQRPRNIKDHMKFIWPTIEKKILLYTSTYMHLGLTKKKYHLLTTPYHIFEHKERGKREKLVFISSRFISSYLGTRNKLLRGLGDLVWVKLEFFISSSY